MLKNNLSVAVAATLLSSAASADQLETITVIGSNTDSILSDPHQNVSLLENIMPTQAFSVGGAGGFAGFNERGTQSNHTVVYRNGVPVNDAGAGWYDFGHDFATGNESVLIKNGPNGTMYGSASMGGAVFINDNITYGSVIKYGADTTIISSSPSDHINLTYADINNGSVRTDNSESDIYKNLTLRLQSDEMVAGFVLNYAYTDYEYDYDDCYDANWAPSNNCVQKGQKHSLSMRNDNFTFGYNSNSAEYFTDANYLSYNSDAENYYFDARERFVYDRNIAIITGVTATKEKYIGKSAKHVETYALVQYQDWMDLGFRYTGDTVVSRLGLTEWGIGVNLSTSYRNPNLYELNGDGAWVFENQDLLPEEGTGIEVSYAGFSAFRYKFTQGIDFDFATSTYVNTGAYETQGVRFSDTYDVVGGALSVYAGYTDTELPGVPETKMSLGYTKQLDQFSLTGQYTTQNNRGTDWSGTQYDDVSTVDLFVSYDWSSSIDITLSAEDLLDREFEVAPGYGGGGREFNLTITYR